MALSLLLLAAACGATQLVVELEVNERPMQLVAGDERAQDVDVAGDGGGDDLGLAG